MRFEEVTRSTPGQYISEAGALKYLPDALKLFKRPFIVTGVKSYAAFLKHSPVTLDVPVLHYDATSSTEDMERLATEATGADVIVAIGGGKVCDTAKGLADLLNCDVITVPTVIGTCAPTTPVSALYTPDKVFKGVGYYQRCPFACIVDLNLLVDSPEAYFTGGICDTLAKWYEAESITRHIEGHLEANVALGLAAAQVTRTILLRDTHAALEALNKKQVDDTFKRVVDTVFNVSGAVGCFACEKGRMSGAHAVHNALSQFDETHYIQHGVKVSYGLLVQLAAMEELDEVKRLIQFYKENGFIYAWSQLKIAEAMETAVSKMATFAASDIETFRLAVPNVTPEQVVAATYTVEELAHAN